MGRGTGASDLGTGRGSVFQPMINTQASALYFGGKLYLCFRYFSEITSISSVQFSHSVVSDSLQPHGLQQARSPCPSPTPGVYSNSCPLSR